MLSYVRSGTVVLSLVQAKLYGLERDVLFAPISMLAASVLVSVSPAERAAVLREEVCNKLNITKVTL
jgi:hypothetical protein